MRRVRKEFKPRKIEDLGKYADLSAYDLGSGETEAAVAAVEAVTTTKRHATSLREVYRTIFDAVRDGNLELLTMVLNESKTRERFTADTENASGITPLQTACELYVMNQDTYDLKIVEGLVAAGANPSHNADEEGSPRYFAFDGFQNRKLACALGFKDDFEMLFGLEEGEEEAAVPDSKFVPEGSAMGFGAHFQTKGNKKFPPR